MLIGATLSFKFKTFPLKSFSSLFNTDSGMSDIIKKSLASAAIVSTIAYSSPQVSIASQPLLQSSTIYTAANSALPVVGTDAPDFSLPSNVDGGKKISLSDFKGHRTVLYFYPGNLSF